jgi:hypothetical protein
VPPDSLVESNLAAPVFPKAKALARVNNIREDVRDEIRGAIRGLRGERRQSGGFDTYNRLGLSAYIVPQTDLTLSGITETQSASS